MSYKRNIWDVLQRFLCGMGYLPQAGIDINRRWPRGAIFIVVLRRASREFIPSQLPYTVKEGIDKMGTPGRRSCERSWTAWSHWINVLMGITNREHPFQARPFYFISLTHSSGCSPNPTPYGFLALRGHWFIGPGKLSPLHVVCSKISQENV